MLCNRKYTRMTQAAIGANNNWKLPHAMHVPSRPETPSQKDSNGLPQSTRRIAGQMMPEIRSGPLKIAKDNWNSS